MTCSRGGSFPDIRPKMFNLKLPNITAYSGYTGDTQLLAKLSTKKLFHPKTAVFRGGNGGR